MPQSDVPARLAVDIGGTFTDIVLLVGKRRLVSKLLTTPRAPEQAVIVGVREILARSLLAISPFSYTARRSQPTPSSSARVPEPRC
jgi:hypothetical protein